MIKIVNRDVIYKAYGVRIPEASQTSLVVCLSQPLSPRDNGMARPQERYTDVDYLPQLTPLIYGAI